MKNKLNFYFDTFVVFPNLEFYRRWIHDFYRWWDFEIPKMLAGEKYKKFPSKDGYPKFVKNFEDFTEKPQIIIKRRDLKFEDKLFTLPVINGVPRFIFDVINNKVVDIKNKKYKNIPRRGVGDLIMYVSESYLNVELFPQSGFSGHKTFTCFLSMLDIPYTVNLIGEQTNNKVVGKKWYVIDYMEYVFNLCNEISLYEDVIDHIRDNDINLMFLTPQEAYYDREKFNTIVKFCISRNFPPDRIFYLNQTVLDKPLSHKIKPYMSKSKVGSINHYSVVGGAFFTNFHEKTKGIKSYTPSVNLEKKKRSKHFYYVIGSLKFQRIVALKYFYNTGLLDKMNWSSRYKINEKEFNKITPKLFEDDLKYNIATSTSTEYGFKDNFYIPKKTVEDSYISIVFTTDPSGYDYKLYDDYEKTNKIIDEKIFKPIVYLHPFICFANPNTLSYFRDWGFETFPELFDESYDEINDHDERLEFVIKQIEQISKLPLDEMHDLYNKVYPKLVRNRDLLLSMDIKKEYESWFEVE